MSHDTPQLRKIDLPPDQWGSDCLICEAVGSRQTARFLDRDGGPVCEECFLSLLNIEAALALVNYRERKAA